ncbi:PRE_C2HC domain-containing protein [Nephila pilipes]|uniref:PRE_C2HC domain-containing protein n=1 Tax=Nephila pilipes TaxID=299642 RepID=A0A8X6U2Y4_NEPPI|nr:PRE_C2HC domain-containing protein [Nephila pilipes]
MNSAPLSESEKETSEKVTPPLLPFSRRPMKAEGGGENNGFTVLTNKKKRVSPIFIDECLDTPDLLKEISEKTKSKFLGRIVNGKLKVFSETPNEHRIIQNFISVKKLKPLTFEMQNEKMLKAVIRGLPADYDIKELISEIQLQGFNPDHVSVWRNRRNNTNMPLFLAVLKKPLKLKTYITSAILVILESKLRL